ncbi:hypothetical protein STFR1_110024 [Bacillus vallismortis]
MQDEHIHIAAHYVFMSKIKTGEQHVPRVTSLSVILILSHLLFSDFNGALYHVTGIAGANFAPAAIFHCVIKTKVFSQLIFKLI